MGIDYFFISYDDDSSEVGRKQGERDEYDMQ